MNPERYVNVSNAFGMRTTRIFIPDESAHVRDDRIIGQSSCLLGRGCERVNDAIHERKKNFDRVTKQKWYGERR